MLKHLWVRLMAALSVCLFTVQAFAADAATDLGAVTLGHPVLALIGTLNGTLTKMFQSDVSWAPTWLLRYRVLASLGTSLLGAWIDMVMNGTGYTVALVAALGAWSPALLMEVFHLFTKGGPGGGGAVGKTVDGTFNAPAQIGNGNVQHNTSMRPPPAPCSTKFAVLGLAVALAVIPGCVGAQKAIHDVVPVLNTVVTDVQDAEQVLDFVRSIVDVFFLEHASPEAKTKVAKAMADAQLALTLAEQATNGVANLTEGREAEAFAGFKVAFDTLVKLLGELGIADTGGKVAAPHGTGRIAIPVPIVIVRGRS